MLGSHLLVKLKILRIYKKFIKAFNWGQINCYKIVGSDLRPYHFIWIISLINIWNNTIVCKLVVLNILDIVACKQMIIKNAIEPWKFSPEWNHTSTNESNCGIKETIRSWHGVKLVNPNSCISRVQYIF